MPSFYSKTPWSVVSPTDNRTGKPPGARQGRPGRSRGDPFLHKRFIIATLGCTAETGGTSVRPSQAAGPAQRPAATDDGQVGAVPSGAPDTGLRPRASGTSGSAVETGSAAAAGALVLSAGGLRLRRRLKGQG